VRSSPMSFAVGSQLTGTDVPNNGIPIGIPPSGRRSSIKIGGVQVEWTGLIDPNEPAATLLPSKQ
jgi:hypothetical protein